MTKLYQQKLYFYTVNHILRTKLNEYIYTSKKIYTIKNDTGSGTRFRRRRLVTAADDRHKVMHKIIIK